MAYKPKKLDTHSGNRRYFYHASASPVWLAAGVILLGAACVFLLLFAGNYFFYRKSAADYAALAAQYAVAADAPPAASGSRLDFTALQAQNADTVGWLALPAQSLPVVHAADNTYYLRRGFDGGSAPGGCPFLAAECAADWSSLYNVVYGHNLYDGSMFAGLLRYAGANYYAQHPTFTLYTPAQDYTARIFSCHSAEDGDPLYSSGWIAGEEYDAFLAALKEVSAYDTGVTPAPGDRVLTLSTCATSYASDTRRFVVHAILTPQ